MCSLDFVIRTANNLNSQNPLIIIGRLFEVNKMSVIASKIGDEIIGTTRLGGSYPVQRNEVVTAIIKNLTEAGVLLPDEIERYREVVSRYDEYQLLQVLDESNRQNHAWI